MTRRQARLWEQRKFLYTQQLRHEARNEMLRQWQVRTAAEDRTRYWWNSGADGGETKLDITSSSTSYGRLETVDHHEMDLQARRETKGIGYPCENTTDSFIPTGSRKTLYVEKTCNRALTRMTPTVLAKDPDSDAVHATVLNSEA
ncbi:hypothetical protein F442_21660 [Phytophthora nicotianae P10297]|nr:hypothetical protein L917_20923 [Phytophthora nicotianae]ETM31508.1 hypothetical protein L914_20940 [Phytophthora nicotianae]ETO59911.1 hypothetical protein F444_21824 [Phytophthora nicotianae P1976]ETP29154.1 hypothetical protein F442_21660 [Phytophthora nicotianae P10297]